ncbi:TetR/AcrR family transcriptional regulator [Nocardia sp. NPDC052566]|uniref:TetR/AcrR family transcriptional regulator n=1 Tax=Nocardia sp. NPDC052566 TaxID=3364330 RepID=UPI0037C91974
MSDGAPTRGRIDKREAIVRAAFTVFARRGYDQACVQEIADTAHVAKPTVYNHLTDKATLFRHALEAAADTVGNRCVAAVDLLRAPGNDLTETFNAMAGELLSACADEQGRALHRLAHSATKDFPELAESVHRRTAARLTDALADRLAQLMLSQRLRSCPPDLAAEQFLSLLTGPMEHRSRLSTYEVPAADITSIAHAGVDTFLRAYAPAG